MSFIKTVDVDVEYVQIHQLPCQHCNQLYHILVQEQFSARAMGKPIMSTDDELCSEAIAKIKAKLGEQAYKRTLGLGSCAHCFQPQSWMLKRIYLRYIRKYAILWTVVGALIGYFFGVLMPESLPAAFGQYLLLGLAGSCIFGVLFGAMVAKSKFVPVGKKDPRSKTYEELKAHIGESMAQNIDPALLWFSKLGNKRSEDKMMYSLGVDHNVDRFFVLEVWRTPTILQKAEQDGYFESVSSEYFQRIGAAALHTNQEQFS